MVKTTFNFTVILKAPSTTFTIPSTASKSFTEFKIRHLTFENKRNVELLFVTVDELNNRNIYTDDQTPPNDIVYSYSIPTEKGKRTHWSSGNFGEWMEVNGTGALSTLTIKCWNEESGIAGDTDHVKDDQPVIMEFSLR